MSNTTYNPLIETTDKDKLQVWNGWDTPIMPELRGCVMRGANKLPRRDEPVLVTVYYAVKGARHITARQTMLPCAAEIMPFTISHPLQKLLRLVENDIGSHELEGITITLTLVPSAKKTPIHRPIVVVG